jgi:hypothetical protein
MSETYCDSCGLHRLTVDETGRCRSCRRNDENEIRNDLDIPKVNIACNVESIVELLHSIKKLSVDGGYLEAWFDKDQYGSSITSFIPDSFTRDLLELIEYHILGSNEPNNKE